MPSGKEMAIVRIIAIFLAMVDKCIGYFGTVTEQTSNCGAYVNVTLTSCGTQFAQQLASLLVAGTGLIANITTGLGVAWVT